MSCKINLQGLPTLVYGDILTADSMSMNRRTPGNALSALTFPKSKSSLWDPSPTGDVVGLHLCYYRNPHLRVLEKALRLAHRHAQQRNKPTFCCFLLGSISVDEDEEGVTLTLDRFDPGRDGPGIRVPSLVLPGDVVVPVQLVLHRDKDPLVRPSDLSNTFKALQQACSGGEVADLSQLLGVRGQVSCSQQGDQLGFSLRWLAASCASGFDVVGVRPLPIIPTALARSLSGISNPGPPRPGLSNPGPPRPSISSSGALRPGLLRPLKQQRGFLTMDQTRKLLLLLESDPKACSLPLVGVWLSGVVQPSNPQVWAWCLRFSHSAALHDRVLSEQGWFLLVLFSTVPSQPRFYQCRSTGKQSAPMDYLLLSCSQDITLFKHVEPAEGHYLQGDFSVDETTQMDPLQGRAANPVSSLLVATVDQDSGVEDEDLSPRPSPSPHAPTQQTRRIQPSVPELSLLVDASLPPTPQPCTTSSSRRSCSPHPYLHSTPAAPLSQTSGGFWTPPTLTLPQPSPVSTSTQLGSSSCPRPSPHPDPGGLQTGQSPALPCSCPRPGPSAEGGALPSDAYHILMAQERQLQLLQAQIQMLLETQVRYQAPSAQAEDAHPPSPTPPRPTTASVAVGTGASLLWSSTDGPLTTLGRDIAENQPSSPLSVSTQELHGTSGVESPVLEKRSSVSSDTSATQPDQQNVLPTLLLQVSSRLQASLSDHGTPSSPSSSSSSSSSSSYCDRTRSYRKQEVPGHFHKKQEVSEGVEKQRGVSLEPRPNLNTHAQTASTLDSISPALLPIPAQTPRDPLLPGDLSPAQTPRVPRLPCDFTLTQTPRDSLLPGDLSPAQTPRVHRLPTDSSLTQNARDPLLFQDLSLTHTLREPLRAGGSVDLSLEANAIALRYLSDSQLSRLSVGRGGQAALGSPERSVLTPSNMSLATRGYMRRYGLIEEEDDEEEEDQEEEGVTCTLLRTESSLPQSQLIRDLQPKLRLLAQTSRNQDKENQPTQQRSPLGAGSVGNFLDVGRLRQLPKLF